MQKTALFISYLSLGLFVCVCLVGCKSPNPTPEILDPLYRDLQERKTAADKAVEDQKKKLDEARGKVAKLEARDPFRGRIIRELYENEKQLDRLKQQAEYFEIRVDQRRTFARKEYLKAFEADKEWPDPKEYAQYSEVQKLRNAPRDWNKRVPQLTRHLKAPAEQISEKKPAEGEKPAAGGH